MEAIMKDGLVWIFKKVMGGLFIAMEMPMKANFEMIKLMEKEYIIVTMGISILGFGETINNKDKDIRNLRMALNTREYIKMEKRMGMVFTNGGTVANTKEISNKTVFMVKEFTTGTHKNMMGSGFIL